MCNTVLPMTASGKFDYAQQAQSMPSRANFNERLISRIQRASSEARTLEQATRLAQILDKYPEFGEFIDIVVNLGLIY